MSLKSEQNVESEQVSLICQVMRRLSLILGGKGTHFCGCLIPNTVKTYANMTTLLVYSYLSFQTEREMELSFSPHPQPHIMLYPVLHHPKEPYSP